MSRITHLVMDDLVPSNFLPYHTSDAILGHISILVEICGSLLIGMIHSQLRDTCRVDDLFPFYYDSPMEPFLSHSVRLMLSDIVMIL